MAAPHTTCSIADCNKPALTRGWCSPHYQRWRAHGDPLGGKTSNGEPIRFLETVAILFAGEECLIWPFGKDEHGHGRVWLEGKLRHVSRVVCERVHGPAPTPEHEAAHSCGNGHLGCCNQRHLRWVTPAENEADKIVHGTHNRGERQWCSKLTEADVHKIRALQGKMLQREIAEMFGVTRATVSCIQRHRIWAWLK